MGYDPDIDESWDEETSDRLERESWRGEGYYTDEGMSDEEYMGVLEEIEKMIAEENKKAEGK